MVRHLPADAALVRHIRGDDSAWDLQSHLLALIADTARLHLWLVSRDGQKNRNRPKPIPRPGVDDGVERTRIGGTTIKPAAEVAAILGM